MSYLDPNWSPPAPDVAPQDICLQRGVPAKDYKCKSCMDCEESCTWLHPNTRLTLQVKQLSYHNPHCIIAEGYFIDYMFSKHLRFDAAVTRKMITVAVYIEDYVTTPETAAVQQKIPAGSWQVEIYQGENYIVGSHLHSYSRSYPHGNRLPAKYQQMAQELKAMIQVEDTSSRLQSFLSHLQVQQP